MSSKWTVNVNDYSKESFLKKVYNVNVFLIN